VRVEIFSVAEIHAMFNKHVAPSIGVLLVAIAAAGSGQAPPNDQPTASSLRKLTGDDAKRAAELDKAIKAALSADHWDEAIARTRELLDLRTRVQGPKHFETVNAEWRLKTLGRVAHLSKEDRAAYQSANAMDAEGETLYAQGKYSAARRCSRRSS
jgi:hypothetical protein